MDIALGVPGCYDETDGVFGQETVMNIPVAKDKIESFCRANHIRKLSIFGSALRADFGPDSDVDVLVEFEAAHVPGFFRLVEMEQELSAMMGSRKIDMRTPNDLSRYFRDEVIRTAEVQYAQAG
jgi:predicted nucleotidyltransferase